MVTLYMHKDIEPRQGKKCKGNVHGTILGRVKEGKRKNET